MARKYVEVIRFAAGDPTIQKQAREGLKPWVELAPFLVPQQHEEHVLELASVRLDAKQALNVYSRLVSFFVSWGSACLALKDYEKAEVAYSRALGSPALANLLSSKSYPGQGEDAEDDVIKVWIGVSKMAYETGQYEKAMEYGNKARERNCHVVGVHRCVALAQWALGQEQAAINTLQQAICYEEPWNAINRAALIEEYNKKKASHEQGSDNQA